MVTDEDGVWRRWGRVVDSTIGHGDVRRREDLVGPCQVRGVAGEFAEMDGWCSFWFFGRTDIGSDVACILRGNVDAGFVSKGPVFFDGECD